MENICGEKDCNEIDGLVSCRLPYYKGDVSLWNVLLIYGVKSAWSFLTNGWLDTYEQYCANHCQKNGYCYGCGEFWAGSESFDFGNGLCSNCEGDPDIDPNWDNEYEPEGWEVAMWEEGTSPV